MEKYQSNKIVHAEQMTSFDWVEYRKTLDKPHSDSSVDACLDGYHVVYNKGLDNEYHSWCPKKEFESGNSKL